MGTRICYVIRAEETSAVVAALFSNGSHPEVDPEELAGELEGQADGPTALLESMLAARYKTAGGNHRAGDRVFWLNNTWDGESDAGEHERVVELSTVTSDH